VRRNDNRIGIGDLIDGFLFSLQAEASSIRTIEYYKDLLHPFLVYAHEKTWPDDFTIVDTHRVREFLAWVGSRTCEYNMGNGAIQEDYLEASLFYYCRGFISSERKDAP